jgi:hypothetical protein
MRASRRHDLGIAAALLVFVAAMWLWLIPTYAGSGDQVLLPRFIALVIGGLAILMVGGAVLDNGGGKVDDDPFVERGGGEPPRVVALAAVWGVYAFALGLTGFYLGGAVALIASFLLLGARRPMPILACTAGTLLGIWLVFEMLFELRLPRGVLEQALINLA